MAQSQYYYAFVQPIDGAGGIMFSDCPSVCACICTYVHARVEAFCSWLAVDFCCLVILSLFTAYSS